MNILVSEPMLLGVVIGIMSLEHAPGPGPGLDTIPDYRPDQGRRPALGLADSHPVGEPPARRGKQSSGRGS